MEINFTHIVLVIFWALAVFAFISLAAKGATSNIVSAMTEYNGLTKPIVPEENAFLLDRFQTDCKNADISPTSANFVIWLETHGYIIINSETITNDAESR